jgi:dipeptidyl aminopeptidase/acylaminoacyl peptidase
MKTENIFAALLLAAAPAWAASPYQKPPKPVLDVLHAPQSPTAIINPSQDRLLLGTAVRQPPIAYVAQPMLKLAGQRINPRTRTQHGAIYFSAFELVSIPAGETSKVRLPEGLRAGMPSWSSDGKLAAFAVIADTATELWTLDAGAAVARRVEGVTLNPTLGYAFQWLPGLHQLLAKTVPAGLGPAPAQPETPPGPEVQEADGKKGPSSTYEARDTLKSAHDEALFDHYGASQLVLIDADDRKVEPLGKPDLYTRLAPAPSGKYLLTERVHRPYSYIATYRRFPSEAELWDFSGKLLRSVASSPLADSVPIWGVPAGPRDFEWAQNGYETLYWAEALDEGNWKNKVPFRDRLMALKAPFTGEPREVLRIPQRLTYIVWGEREDTVFINDEDTPGHWWHTYVADLRAPKPELRTLWSFSTDEKYKHPGWLVGRVNPDGRFQIRQEGDYFYTSGQGGSPEGDRPFLDKVHLGTGQGERLFRSERTAYESFAALLDPAAGKFLARRETPQEPPNYFVRTLKDKKPAEEGEAAWESSRRAVTTLPDPAPALRAIKKKLVKYKRADGLDLSFTLYLPPGYKEGQKLPAVLYAYPLDYADPKMAGQVAGSDQRFTQFYGASQLYYLLDGYAVIDNAQIPVVGDTDKMYDTYLEQLKAGAQAAVDKAVELGVDRERIGVTGHSHGALMTANLLIHTDLFQAGVARSGAYNRTLTAFGFQNERRLFWEAPEVYGTVSAFHHAHKLKKPLLLVHGLADANPGTTPMQSQFLFEAVRGNGGTVRLLMLPHENHGYTAMESVETVLAESLEWLRKYVKKESGAR